MFKELDLDKNLIALFSEVFGVARVKVGAQRPSALRWRDTLLAILTARWCPKCHIPIDISPI